MRLEKPKPTVAPMEARIRGQLVRAGVGMAQTQESEARKGGRIRAAWRGWARTATMGGTHMIFRGMVKVLASTIVMATSEPSSVSRTRKVGQVWSGKFLAQRGFMAPQSMPQRM